MEPNLTTAEFLNEDGHGVMDADLASDDLDVIVGLMRDQAEIIGKLRSHVRAGTLHIKADNLRDSSAIIDETLRDLLSNDYSRLLQICGTISHSTYVPSVDDVLAEAAKSCELTQACALRVPTNPQTHADLGKPIGE